MGCMRLLENPRSRGCSASFCDELINWTPCELPVCGGVRDTGDTGAPPEPQPELAIMPRDHQRHVFACAIWYALRYAMCPRWTVILLGSMRSGGLDLTQAGRHHGVHVLVDQSMLSTLDCVMDWFQAVTSWVQAFALEASGEENRDNAGVDSDRDGFLSEEDSESREDMAGLQMECTVHEVLLKNQVDTV